MGTSVSVTQTHQRLQNQRVNRKQKKIEPIGPNVENYFAINQGETNKQDRKFREQNQLRINENPKQTLERYEIHLKTDEIKKKEEKTTIEVSNKDKKFQSKKQSLRESLASHQNLMAISKIQPENKMNEPSSMQKINLSPIDKRNPQVIDQSNSGIKKLNFGQQKKQSHIQAKNDKYHKKESSIKLIPDQQIKLFQQNKNANVVQIQHSSPSKQQYSQFADKQAVQKQRKRKQQAIRYIKEADFLSGKKVLSNNPYQVNNHKSNRRVEELLPSRSLAIDLAPKDSSKYQNLPQNNIKLKTEEETLEDLKAPKANQSMTLNKDKKYSGSMNTVNRRF